MTRSKYSQWYADRRWRKRRELQLHREPLCKYCEKLGVTTVATIADHIEPHRGDPEKFWRGELMSLCGPCHSSIKQKIENGKAVSIIGVDGWPTSIAGAGGDV